MNTNHTANVLLVEDNPGDVRLLKEFFNDQDRATELNVVTNGIDALSYVRREEPYKDSLQPDLIILDLNLPRMSGIEVLRTIKNDDILKHIPVLILTTSNADEDIFNAYEAHANAYLVKPLEFSHFATMVNKLKEFWLSVVHLPRVIPGLRGGGQ
ncbi:MAG: response regulator [Gemmatimonadota bacterium]|nr:response regulator [Gemmatimonadota bacterium]MDH5805180.1 response regulator [Gemmatimonadota bacterium]